MVDEALRADPEIDYLYSDEDKIADDGSVYDTFYKPDWSPERLRAQNYCTHLSVLRRSRWSRTSAASGLASTAARTTT